MTPKIDALDSVLSEEEAALAKTAQRCMMKALDHSHAQKVVLFNQAGDDAIATLELPPKALRLIADLLGAMSQRQAVALVPRGHELTTQEAANFLNVSRPFVIKQIAEGKLTCTKVGRHRRIAFEELTRFQREMKASSESALQSLTDQAQKLNLGY
jgi:excisionase family DNA binding protein